MQLKMFSELSKLNGGTDQQTRMAKMVTTLAEPKKCRGIVTHRNNGLAWAMIVGEGRQAFIPTNLTAMNDLWPGDVIEMTIIENDYKHRDKTPYRVVTLTKVDAEVQTAPAPAPEPAPEPIAPRIPRVEGLQPGTFADQVGPEMLEMMKPDFVYQARDFAHLVPENHSKKLTNVLEALLAIGRVQRISLHSSPEKKAGRLYWCLPGQGPKILAQVFEHQGGEECDDE